MIKFDEDKLRRLDLQKNSLHLSCSALHREIMDLKLRIFPIQSRLDAAQSMIDNRVFGETEREARREEITAIKKLLSPLTDQLNSMIAHHENLTDSYRQTLQLVENLKKFLMENGFYFEGDSTIICRRPKKTA
jgi:hypothetical protein